MRRGMLRWLARTRFRRIEPTLPTPSNMTRSASTNPIYGMFAGITGDFDSGVLFDAPNRSALECLIDCDDPGGWDGIGGGGGFGGTDPSGNPCDPTDDPNCIFNPITPPGGLPGPIGGSESGGSGTVGGSNILPGEDCVGCYSLGPSPMQILQALLSGNVLGALQGIGVFPNNGCDFDTVCIPGPTSWTADSQGNVIGSFPGEALCQSPWPCIYWDPDSQTWGANNSTPQQPQQTPQQTEKQPWYCGAGNSWSRPFTAPSGRQWGQWSIVDGATYVLNKYVPGNPASDVLTVAAFVEGWGWATCD
jgi:hypothetical protein